jgi:hypothetical protein
MRLLLLTTLALGCAESSRPHGTAECAAFDEACPAECNAARERLYDRERNCWRLGVVACAKQRAVGFTAAEGCCVREDGLIFKPSSGGFGCTYREPDFIGFRACAIEDGKGLRADDCP